MINTASIANIKSFDFEREIQELVDGGTDMFHIDIMDGHYVKNLCFPVSTVWELKERYPQIPAEVHLMVDNPADYIQPLKEAGADYVAFHVDSTSFVIRTLKSIRAAGMKAGVVINPSQSMDIIKPFIGLLDHVIVMSVEPGFAGQAFLEGSLERIEELARMRAETNTNFLINVDGGVTPQLAMECRDRGVDMIVTTVHTVFHQPDGITAACRRFKEMFE